MAYIYPMDWCEMPMIDKMYSTWEERMDRRCPVELFQVKTTETKQKRRIFPGDFSSKVHPFPTFPTDSSLSLSYGMGSYRCPVSLFTASRFHNLHEVRFAKVYPKGRTDSNISLSEITDFHSCPVNLFLASSYIMQLPAIGKKRVVATVLNKIIPTSLSKVMGVDSCPVHLFLAPSFKREMQNSDQISSEVTATTTALKWKKKNVLGRFANKCLNFVRH